MTVPAVCELNCGVLAAGRCARCGRAYCGSHAARDDGPGRLSDIGLDRNAACAECVEPAGRETALQQEERDRVAQQSKAEARRLIDNLIAALAAADWPGLVEVRRFLYAFPVGVAQVQGTWQRGREPYIGTHPAYIGMDGRLFVEGIPSGARAHPDPDTLVRAAAALARVAAAHGVHV